MKLTSFLKVLTLASIISFSVPSSAIAADAVRDTTGSVEVYSKIVTRLSEIQSMDKNNLSASEKKSLKKELKDMKKAADGLNRGVYLSVGAIIIIILLLILIL
ncbi:MAG TPA: hypothetical protein PLY34_06705 [Ferruginibacter sp.]|nr:hypothetical protein [Ferruginibacter sp.]HPH91137.1 hypothetical protein [Ferruginibacter sp.]